MCRGGRGGGGRGVLAAIADVLFSSAFVALLSTSWRSVPLFVVANWPIGAIAAKMPCVATLFSAICSSHNTTSSNADYSTKVGLK